MTTVVCVGIAVRDIVLAVDASPVGGGKIRASRRVNVGGGPAANAAVTIASLGGTARFIGPIGDDPTGSDLSRELSDSGVDTTLMRVVPGAQSSLSAVLVDPAGERTIINHTDGALFDEAASVEPSEMFSADAVLADVRWHQGAHDALLWATENGVPGVLDFDIGFRDESLLALATHVVCSRDAMAAISGTENMELGLQYIQGLSPAWVAVTAGKNGTYWLENGAIMHQPGFSVDVVDTLAAGDVFHGAFALAIAAEPDAIRSAVNVASAAAAISCTRFGGRLGIPDRAELERFLSDHT